MMTLEVDFPLAAKAWYRYSTHCTWVDIHVPRLFKQRRWAYQARKRSCIQLSDLAPVTQGLFAANSSFRCVPGELSVTQFRGRRMRAFGTTFPSGAIHATVQK